MRFTTDPLIVVNGKRFETGQPFHVAEMWQDDQRRPVSVNDCQRISAGQPHGANHRQQQSLSVPRFPWYY